MYLYDCLTGGARCYGRALAMLGDSGIMGISKDDPVVF